MDLTKATDKKETSETGLDLYNSEKNRQKRLKASLTVEAAFILPISFWFICAFIYFFLFLHTQFTVCQGMLSTADRLESYGTLIAYAENSFVMSDAFGIAEEGWLKQAEELAKSELAAFLSGRFSDGVIESTLEDVLSENESRLSCVRGGSSGVSCDGSYAYSGSGTIFIKAEYTFEFPDFLFFAKDINVEQKLEVNGFYGVAWNLVHEFESERRNDEELNTEYVYVARTGTVYHTNANCTYISVKTEGLSPEEAASRRNGSGAKYYPCEYCGYSAGDTVYITYYGNRYHSREDCSRINRDVSRVPKSQAIEEGRKLCSKCSRQ